VRARIADNDGGATEYTASVTISNVAPTVSLATLPGCALVRLGTPTAFSGSFTDPGVADTHTAQWIFGTNPPVVGTVSETNGSGTVGLGYTPGGVGVYSATLRVTDKDGAVGSASSSGSYAVAYNPGAVGMAGGGSVKGTDRFCFAANMPTSKGAPPVGAVEFSWAGKTFRSTALQSLLPSGAMVRLTGSGTVDGAAGYSFTLIANDGQAVGGGGTDAFRLKVWNTATNAVVYDNMPGKSDTLLLSNLQPIDAGGSVLRVF
jgi:hypothetical protein